MNRAVLHGVEDLRAVVFDVGGTLVVSYGDGLCDRIARAAGRPIDKLRDAIDRCLRTRTAPFSVLVRGFADASGISEASLYNAGIGERAGHWEVYGDVWSCLNVLTRFEMATLSNCAHWERADLETLGIAQYLEAEIYSFEAEFTKPDQRMYQAAENRLGRRPHQLLFVGDTVADVLGAIAHGWRAVLLRRVSTSNEDALSVPVISTLNELPELLYLSIR